MTRTWPLAVSSLGAPDADLPRFVELARAAGCAGVELRLGADQPVHVGLTADQRRVCRGLLDEAGLRILCLGSYVKVCAEGSDDEIVDELAATLALAEDLGAEAVRVFPGGTGEAVDDERARRRLDRSLGHVASGVRILVETHDSHPRGSDVARLLDGIAVDAAVGAIWDVAHTLVAGEAPRETLRHLGDRLAHVQVKDVERLAPGSTPALPGDGVLPLGEVAAALGDAGYTGFVSLEWEKAWFPGIAGLATALTATNAWLGAVSPPRD